MSNAIAERIEVNKEMPWGEWTNPEIHPVALANLRVAATNDHLQLRTIEGEVIGDTTFRGLQELGHRVGYDATFVSEKLPADIAAEVINHRIQAHRDREVAVVTQEGRFTSFMPSVREVLTYSETAQVAYNLMADVYGDLQIDHAGIGDHGMRLRLLTDLQQPVTRRVGDTLGLGVEVRQNYGETIEVQLYLRRLICLNGMTTEDRAFSWQNRQEGTRGHQQLFLARGIADALGAFDQVVERSRLMAETKFEGSPEEALRARAQAMGFPLRHINDVIQAFNEEPGDDEWLLLNAFTRVGTHTALPNGLGRRVRSAAGDWAGNFDMVNCRMPRPMAVRAGATIISSIDAIGETHQS